MTPCNFCSLQWLRKQTPEDEYIVTRAGGIGIYVFRLKKGERIEDLGPEDLDPDKPLTRWIGSLVEIPDHCVC